MIRTSERLVGCVVGCLSLLAVACGSHGSSSGPCDIVPTPAECNLSCDQTPGAPNTCPPGLSCNPDGRCYAQCTFGGTECGDGYSCTDDGRCQQDSPPPPPPPDPCPAVNFMAQSVTPSILLLLDRSDSMGNAFGGMTRWAAIRSALTDATTGVVTLLQSKAYFGSMIYRTANPADDTTCPILETRPRALNNADVIRQDLMVEPTFSWTPTTRSINAAVATFAATPPPAGSPPFIVLATDGNPSLCADYGNPEERAAAVAAAAASFAAGIRLFVLSVAEDVDAQHLQDLANAGAGVAAGQPNAPVYVGNNPADLAADFDSIIRGVVSCDVTVNGSVTQDQAAAAVVRLNGRQIIFGTDWILVGDRTIRLQTAACAEFKRTAAPTVNGQFPCGTVIE